MGTEGPVYTPRGGAWSRRPRGLRRNSDFWHPEPRENAPLLVKPLHVGTFLCGPTEPMQRPSTACPDTELLQFTHLLQFPIPGSSFIKGRPDGFIGFLCSKKSINGTRTPDIKHKPKLTDFEIKTKRRCVFLIFKITSIVYTVLVGFSPLSCSFHAYHSFLLTSPTVRPESNLCTSTH